MSEPFSARELIEVAIREEQTGAAFYRALAEKTDSEELRTFTRKLAAVEEMHEQRFRELLGLLEEAGIGHPTAGDYMAYLVEGRIFPTGRDGEELAARIESPEEAAETAMEMERNTLLFYLELRDLIPAKERALLDEIIGEERWHLANWARFRREHFEIGDRP